MFPEIFRDEVFRLETRRLWLRWPVRGDIVGCNDTGKTSTEIYGQSGLDGSQVAAWRAAMTDGASLHLVLAAKADHGPIGIVHLTPNGPASLELDGQLNACSRGNGFMTEAIQAVAHAIFRLADLEVIVALPGVDNAEGRSILQHCGFTYAGSGMRRGRTGRGLEPCDHFRLDHATWSSLQGWVMPGFGRSVSNGASSAPCEALPLTL